MKIILIEDVNKLGSAGDVVTVANGYARNFLLPQKYAILATPYNLQKIEKIRKVADEKHQAELVALKELAAKVNGVELSFTRRVDDNENLFGSVSDVDIANALKEKGLEIRKSVVKLEKAIKELGTFEVVAHFASEVEATIKVVVEAE